jgi:hypothetical protein
MALSPKFEFGVASPNIHTANRMDINLMGALSWQALAQRAAAPFTVTAERTLDSRDVSHMHWLYCVTDLIC